MSSKYSIGYKRPPRSTQFKPGQSGNSKGRPKGSKTLGSVLEKAFGEGVTLKDGKSITKLEAAAKQLANGAAQGDPKKIQLGMDLLSKTRAISAAEKFAIKFMKDGYITPEDAEKYAKGHAEKPGINYTPIHLITVKNIMMLHDMELLVHIAKIESLHELCDMAQKIVIAIFAEGSAWDAFNTMCKWTGVDEKRRGQLIKKFEKTRQYKRPTIELILTAANLYLSLRNMYLIHMEAIRDKYAKNPEYKIKESMYLKDIIKDMLSRFSKDDLSPEELECIQNYEQSFEPCYKGFMSKSFERTDLIKTEFEQSAIKLFDWYEPEK